MNTTTYTGVIKDLTGAVVTSGEVIFTLTPSVDSTLSGVARFVPTKQSFPIASDGTINAVVMQNTAITPSGTCYQITIRPYYSSIGSVFYDFATTTTKDISTVTPTPATGPINYSTAIFSATATSTAAGAQPTVSVTSGGGDYEFAFGIPPGVAGPAATVAVGSVTTGAPGSAASVANVGTSSAAVLNFDLPAGPATISIASVTTLPPGSSATVTDTGSAGAADLNFGLPQGAPGELTVSSNQLITSLSAGGQISANLCNNSAMVAGYIDTNGNLQSGSGFHTTPLIPCAPGVSYYCNVNIVHGASLVCYFATDGSFVSSDTGTFNAGTPIVPPAHVAFLRFSVTDTTSGIDWSKITLATGGVLTQWHAFGTYSADVIDAKDAAVISGVSANALQTVLEFQPQGINYFDKLAIPTGNVGQILLLDGSGLAPEHSTPEAFYTSQLIPVVAGQQYNLSVAINFSNGAYAAYAFYSAAKQFVSAVSSQGLYQVPNLTITVPSGCSYVAFSGDYTQVGLQMLTATAAVPSAYVPFAQLPIAYTAASFSRLNGLNVGIWGDSIASIFGQKWQTAFAQITKANLYRQIARPGATIFDGFEAFGTQTPQSSLSALGPYNGTNPLYNYSGQLVQQYNIYYNVPANGTSLTAVLAPLNVLFVALGTNDAGQLLYQLSNPSTSQYPNGVGTIDDSYTAGTLHAAMNFFCDGLQASAPLGLRIIPVLPLFCVNGATTTGSASTNSDGSGCTLVITPGNAAYTNSIATQDQVSAAWYAQAKRRGWALIDLRMGGLIGPQNVAEYTRDGTHPNDYHFINVYGPNVAAHAALAV